MNEIFEQQIEFLKRATDIETTLELHFTTKELAALFDYLYASNRELWLQGEIALELESREFALVINQQPLSLLVN